jgi:hypothetical protein
MEKTVRTAMRGESGPDDDIAIGELSTAGGKISFLVRDLAKLDEARERLFSETRGAQMTGQRDWTINVDRFDADRDDPDQRRAGAGGGECDGYRARHHRQARQRARHARADDHPRRH